MRYNLTPARMAIINKPTKNKARPGCGKRGTLFALLVRMQTGAATEENNMEITQKIKNGFAF